MTRKGSFAKDYSLKDQARRAAVSIMSNIAEGYARQTDKEFTRAYELGSETARLINGFVKYLKGN